MPRLLFAAALSAVALLPVSARAELKSYYVAFDTRAELTSGTYVGLPNPNFDHFSLVEASPHSDHFHGISHFTYAGDPSSPTVVTIPETRIPPVSHGANCPSDRS